MRFLPLVLLALVLLPAQSAMAQTSLTDDQIRQILIEKSVAAYLATGHPCACPYSMTRNGRHCGGRSAYSRPGGAAPLCYPQDISDAMVAAYRANMPSGGNTAGGQ